MKTIKKIFLCWLFHKHDYTLEFKDEYGKTHYNPPGYDWCKNCGHWSCFPER